jgi:hypothetical protein
MAFDPLLRFLVNAIVIAFRQQMERDLDSARHRVGWNRALQPADLAHANRVALQRWHRVAI